MKVNLLAGLELVPSSLKFQALICLKTAGVSSWPPSGGFLVTSCRRLTMRDVCSSRAWLFSTSRLWWRAMFCKTWISWEP